MEHERISSNVNFPVPENVIALCRSIGMAQFCNRFIPEFNVKLISLYDLIRKNTPFVWTKECPEAFQYTKD